MKARPESTIRFSERLLTKIANGNDPEYPLPERGRKAYYRDSVEKGMRIEVQPSGTIEFFTRRVVKRGQRPRRFSPGKWPTVTVTAARMYFQNLTADINRRQAVAVARGAQLTLWAGWEHYRDKHLVPRDAKSWKQDEAALRKYAANWLNVRMGDIDREDVIDIHREAKAMLEASGSYRVTNGNRTANKVKTLIYRIYRFCQSTGVHTGANPAHDIKAFTEEVRKRYLREDEMPAFFSTFLAPEIRRPYIAAATHALILLFTGLRSDNGLAIHSTWRSSHFGISVLVIPEELYKTDAAPMIPLTRQAEDIISWRFRLVGPGYLFASPRAASGRMSDPRKTWDALVAATGLEHFNRHDLRRTLDTWMEAAGAPDSIRAKALGQTVPGVRKHYSHAETKAILTWSQKAVDAMVEAAGASLWWPGINSIGVKHE